MKALLNSTLILLSLTSQAMSLCNEGCMECLNYSSTSGEDDFRCVLCYNSVFNPEDGSCDKNGFKQSDNCEVYNLSGECFQCKEGFYQADNSDTLCSKVENPIENCVIYKKNDPTGCKTCKNSF